MKFNINDYYDGNYVMHCPTIEAAKIFLSYLHSVGARWRNGQSYLNYLHYTDSETCYNFRVGLKGSLQFYQRHKYDRYIILEFDDFDWDEDTDLVIDEKDIDTLNRFLIDFQRTSNVSTGF